jgi:hypothetical protein
MTSQQHTQEAFKLRIDAIWTDYEIRGITEQHVVPGIKMKILKTKKIVFQIESSRHPQWQGIKKQVSYDTWEEAYEAHQNLIPQVSRVDNIRKGREKAQLNAIPKEDDAPVLTKQEFIEWVCDQRVRAADAHALAVEHGDKDAFFWSYVDEPIRKLMEACDEARAILEDEDDEADELTLPS